MNRIILMIVFVLALSASGLMFFIGKGSPELEELYHNFWIPLPLALLALLILMFSRKK